MSWFGKKNEHAQPEAKGPTLVERMAQQRRADNLAPNPQRKMLTEAYGPLGFVYETHPALLTEYMNAVGLSGTDDEERRWLIENMTRFPDEAQDVIHKIATRNPPKPEEIELEQRLFYAQYLCIARTFPDEILRRWVATNLERYPPGMREEVMTYATEEDKKRATTIPRKGIYT